MSDYSVNPEAEDFDPTDGWGDVPKADRPLWSRYFLDHCPRFPGAVIMTLIARGVVYGGDRISPYWKDVAADLHGAGFTPIQYYLLANLLKDELERGKLDEAEHGYLFERWFGERYHDFVLDAEAWKPWLERLTRAESPSRALEHMLYGDNVPAMGFLISRSGEIAAVSD